MTDPGTRSREPRQSSLTQNSPPDEPRPDTVAEHERHRTDPAEPEPRSWSHDRNLRSRPVRTGGSEDYTDRAGLASSRYLAISTIFPTFSWGPEGAPGRY